MSSPQVSWQGRGAAIILGLVGLGMLGFWTTWLMQGNLTAGISTVENNQYILFHITAELTTALVALLGAGGVLLGRRWGRLVALLASGMVIYATFVLKICKTLLTDEQGAGAAVFPTTHQGWEVIPEEWEMRHCQHQVKELLPFPHGRKQEIEEHAANYPDFEYAPPAPDQQPQGHFVQRHQHCQA